MIIDTMSFREIAKELNNDFDNEIYLKTIKLNNDSKYRRAILKSTKKGLIKFKSISYTSKQGNKYIITPYTSGRSHYKKTKTLEFSYISTFYYKNSLFVAWYTTESKTLLPTIYFYTAHLFDRYGERFLGKKFEMTDDNLGDFFVRNRAISMKGGFEHPKYKNHVFATFDEGVILGERIDWDIMFFKTYITFDMLKGQQIEMSSTLQPRLENILKNEEKLRIQDSKNNIFAA